MCLDIAAMLFFCRCETKDEEDCPECNKPRFGDGGRRILKHQSVHMVVKRLYENPEGAYGGNFPLDGAMCH